MVEKSTVEQWLAEAGVELLDPGVENEEEFAWTLGFQGPAFRTLVVHADTTANHLIMQVDVTVSSGHREVLGSLDEDTRDRFIFDLRIALLQQPIGYGLNFDEESGLLESLTVGYNLFEDPLQRAGFFRRSHQLQSAALLGSQMIQKLARFREW